MAAPRDSQHARAAGDRAAGEPVLPDALRTVTAAVAAAPKVVLLLALMVTGACVGMTACYLQFRGGSGQLIDPRDPTRAHWDAYAARFEDGADFVVAVEADGPAAIREAVDVLAAKLTAEPDVFGPPLIRVNMVRSREKGLQSLSPEELDRVADRVAGVAPVLRGDWDRVRLETRLQAIGRGIDGAVKRGDGAAVRSWAARGERLADGLAAHVADPADFRSPWAPLTAADPDAGARMERTLGDASYFLNDAGTLGLLYVAPARTESGPADRAAVLDRLREHTAAVAADLGKVQIGVTGVPALEVDEVRRGREDMLRAGGVAFGAVGLLLLIGFRGVKHPVLALFVLAVGLAWSFGFTTFAVGHLNILSVSFAVILIGLGIDFGIHYLARYLQHRQEGMGLEDALCETSSGVGVGILTASVTTALAFFCATFTRFLGVAELGIIAGGGVLLCAAATFLTLPALIALADEHVPAVRLPKPISFTWLRFGTSRFPLIVTVLGFAAVIGVGLQAVEVGDGWLRSGLTFDHTLLALRPGDAESADVRDRIQKAGGPSLLYAVAMADSAEEARDLAEKFEALPTVSRVEDLARRLPGGDRAETRAGVARVRSALAGVPLNAGVPSLQAPRPKTVGLLADRVRTLAAGTGRADLAPLAAKLDRFETELSDLGEAEGPQAQAAALDRYQTRAAGELVREARELVVASRDLTPLGMSDLPTVLKNRLRSGDGKWLLQIYPKRPVWEFGPLRRFVSDLRTVDSAVTGVPVQNFEAGRQVMSSYRSAALYALAIVSLVLLSDFLAQENKLLVLFPPLLVVAFTAMTLLTRGIELDPVLCAGGYVAMALVVGAILDFTNLRDALLALLPPLAGGVMMFGVMALCGVPLNPTNLIVLPLVLGIGVDDGVHVVHDFRSRRDDGDLTGHRGAYEPSPSTTGAIVLTSLTSMIGFGSLAVAGHRGLFSVGVTLVIGIGCALFVSLILLPAVLALLSREPKEAADTVAFERDEEEAEEQPRQRRRKAA